MLGPTNVTDEGTPSRLSDDNLAAASSLLSARVTSGFTRVPGGRGGTSVAGAVVADCGRSTKTIYGDWINTIPVVTKPSSRFSCDIGGSPPSSSRINAGIPAAANVADAEAQTFGESTLKYSPPQCTTGYVGAFRFGTDARGDTPYYDPRRYASQGVDGSPFGLYAPRKRSQTSIPRGRPLLNGGHLAMGMDMPPLPLPLPLPLLPPPPPLLGTLATPLSPFFATPPTRLSAALPRQHPRSAMVTAVSASSSTVAATSESQGNTGSTYRSALGLHKGAKASEGREHPVVKTEPIA